MTKDNTMKIDSSASSWSVVTDIQYDESIQATDYSITSVDAYDRLYDAYEDFTDLCDQTTKKAEKLKEPLQDRLHQYEKNKTIAANAKFFGAGIGLVAVTALSLINKSVDTLTMALLFGTPLLSGLAVSKIYDRKAKNLFSKDEHKTLNELFETKEELTQGLRTAGVLEEMLENFANDNSFEFKPKGFKQKYQEHLMA